MKTQHRRVTRALEIDDMAVERSSTGRIVIARALTYGVPYEVTDDGGRTSYHEVWRSGVFDQSIAQRSGRIPLLVNHHRQSLPIGATMGVEPSDNEFIFRGKVSNTRDGDDTLELIQDGALTGVSIQATLLNNRRIQRGYERIEAKLNEISLTPFAQMSDGEILAVRALVDTDDETETNNTDEEEESETPALDEAKAYLAGLERP